MNNEENKSKELRDSIDRMADELAKVIKTAQSAYDRIAHVELRDGSGAAWRMLSEAVCNLRHTLRPKPGTAAFLTEITDYYCEHEPRLRLMPENEKPDAAPEAGQKKPEVFHTPKEIIDFVTANPKLGEVNDAPTPIDPSAPKIMHGFDHVWNSEPDSVGIARHGNVIQAFAFREGAGVQVFAKQVHADGMYADCWNVTGTIDCEKAIIATVFGGRNRMNKIAKFIRNGLLAARMRNRHYRMNRKARKEAANAERGDLCHED